MVDIVRRIDIQAKATGVAPVVAELNTLTAAQKRLGDASEASGQQVAEAGGASLAVVNKFRALRYSLDEAWRASEKFKQQQNTLKLALKEGAATQEEYNRVLDLLTRKYASVTDAANKAASAQRQFAAASGPAKGGISQRTMTPASALVAATAAERSFQSMTISGSTSAAGAISTRTMAVNQLGAATNTAATAERSFQSMTIAGSAGVVGSISQRTMAVNQLTAATEAATTAQRQFTAMTIAGAAGPQGRITGSTTGYRGGGGASLGMPPVDMIGGMSSVGGPALRKQMADQDFIQKMSGDMTRLGQSTKLTSFEVTNLGMQFNDIAVMAASGQNPMVLIMQQGMQLAQILAMSSVATMGLKGALAALGASFMQFVTNPIYLAVAATAALAGGIMLFSRSFKDDMLPLEDILSRHEDLVKRITKQYELMQVSASVAAAGVPAVLAADIRQQQRQAQAGMMQGLQEGLLFAFPSGGLGGFAGETTPIPRHLAEFKAALQLLDAQFKANKPDVKAFVDEVARIQQTNPEKLDEWGNKLRAGAQEALGFAEILKGLNIQLDLLAGEGEGRAPRAGTVGSGDPARRQQQVIEDAKQAFRVHSAELQAIKAVTDAERVAAAEARVRADAMEDGRISRIEEVEIERAGALEQARIDEENRKAAETAAKQRADEAARLAKQRADEAQRELERRQEILETARFEVSILNKTEEQQAVLNALRELGADATAKERQELEALTRTQFQYNEAIDEWEEKTREAIGRMDEFRSSAKGVLSGFLEEGWKGAADALASRLMGLSEDLVITGLFGAEGKAGGGIFGDAIQNLLGGVPDKPVATMNVVAGVVNVGGAGAGGFITGTSPIGAMPGGMGTGGPGQSGMIAGVPVDTWAQEASAAAQRAGIDPATFLAVLRSEGLQGGTWQSNVYKNGVRETSYGPGQFLVGGGLGDTFQRQTGLDLANQAAFQDPMARQQYLDFMTAQARQSGWGAWYGAANTGIGNWQGINQNAPLTTAATAATPAVDELATSISSLNSPISTAVPGLNQLANSIMNFAPGGGIPNISAAAAAGLAASEAAGFGGFWADGGTLGAGKWGIAGEAGPEIIHGPANITPIRGGGGRGPININVTNIGDARANVRDVRQRDDGGFDVEVFAATIKRDIRDTYGLREPTQRWGRA